ncbi:MAG: type IV pilus assembly protein PilM [Patescibacteria group bacterium]|nr:type IV pilus assembly protein PilM [Patescibacteria group bacterium]
MAKQNSYLGIDLSPDSIKMVELKEEGGKPRLVTYGYTEAKSEILRGDFISNKNLTAALLKEVADKSRVTTKMASAAMPIASVFSTVVKLSNLLKKDLDNRVRIKALLSEEVKKILPRPIEEMVFDFNLMPTEEIEKAASGARIDAARFLITAAPNDVVKDYVDIFKQADFALNSLDIEPFALVRSLIGIDKSLIMIVDIGENRTTLSIVNNTMPIFNRTIQAGGSVVTKAVADSMGITVAEAENYKLDLGIMMAQQGMNAYPKQIEDSLAPIVSEIKYLIKNYYDQSGREKLLDKVILTGGGAMLGNFLDKYLSGVLDLRCYVGDPWARVVYPEEIAPVLKEIGPRFSVALGLAMREFI